MSQRHIRSVLDPKQLLCAPSTLNVLEAARQMKEGDFGAIVVVDEDDVPVGIFTAQDALFRVLAEGRDAGSTTIGMVMTHDPRTIDPDRPIAHALHMMYDGGFRHVPVVEKGRPLGMVTGRAALGPELAEFASDLEIRDHLGEIL